MDEIEHMVALEKDARQFGFDWPNVQMIVDQLLSECTEIQEDITLNSSEAKIQEEIGDLILATISLCAALKLDVKDTITKANTKFEGRMTALKAITHDLGMDHLHGQPIERTMQLWREAKMIAQDL
jgi:uncharacterized protein YabN with tetrapyrrole methylase and pyrophosphatase domain